MDEHGDTADNEVDGARARWDLRKGRNDFIGHHRGMPDKNFWWYVMRRQGQDQVFASAENDPLWLWRPDHSNCPELNEEVLALVGSSPLQWQPLLRSVFVGRALDGDLNAYADQSGGSAWVALSLQLTSVIGAYVAAFDRMNALLMARQRGEMLPDSEIFRVFHQIALSREGWADLSQYVGSHPALQEGPAGRDQWFYAGMVTSSEMFAVSHELAHHLLGHTNRWARGLRIEAELDAIIGKAGVRDLVHRRSPSQTKEMLADLLGLVLAGQPRHGDVTASAYRAAIAIVVVLLAEGDVKDHWFLDDPEGHPPTIDRLAAALQVIPWVSSVPSLGAGDSLDGLRAQLAGFISAGMQSSLHARDPERNPPPTWRQIDASMRGRAIAVLHPAADVRAAGERLPSSSGLDAVVVPAD